MEDLVIQVEDIEDIGSEREKAKEKEKDLGYFVKDVL